MLKDDSMSALEDLLRTAFANTSTADPETLVFAEMWDTNDLIRALTRQPHPVDDDFVEHFFDALAGFTPEGFLYVLPSFLSYCLRHPNSHIVERLAIHLSPEAPQSALWRARLGVFSLEQRQAVCQCLEHFRSTGGGDLVPEWNSARAVWGCDSR